MGIRSGGGRPVRGYRLKDGTRVPSVTTLTSRFKESGGLIQWAYRLGLDGKDMNAERDGAASAGTIAHNMVEGDILGIEPELPTAKELNMTDEQYDVALGRARKSFEAYRSWRKSVGLEVLATEVPLVSEVHRFGGTVDAIARIGGILTVTDWKTSRGVHAEYLSQTAAYCKLWEENHPEDKIEAIHLLRFGKEYSEYSHHAWPAEVIEMGWQAFLHMRKLYDLDQSLKKMVA